jgi:flavin-dependent dehydrogenase
VSYGIRRCEFDAYLLRRSGARLKLGEPLRELRPEPDGWVINGDLRAPLLIGAGGHFCPVARMLARCDPELDDPVVLAQEVEFALTGDQRDHCPIAGSHPELFFCPDLAGYGWIVRKGDYLNIGLGREHERNLSMHLDDFLSFLRARGKLTLDIPQPFRGHAYKLRRHVPPVHVPDRVLLIGDAAGLAYPQSGEGIRPAIESGLIAAETILEAHGHYAGSLWHRYRRRCDRRFGAGRSRIDWVPTTLKQWAAGQLLETGWFSRRVLLDRWFLHAHQPAL